MSYYRDRTAELKGDDSEDFGPRRPPAATYRSGGNNYGARNQPPTNYDPHESIEMRSPPSYAARQQQQQSPPMAAAPPSRPPPQLDTMDGFFSEVDDIKNEVGAVSDNVDRIERLHTSALMSFNEEQSRYISRDLAALKRETQKRNLDIKNRLKELQMANARTGNASDAQIRQSQTAALRKRFLETIQRYQDVERLYDQKYRQRVERQIRIVKPNATQEEVDRFIDSDDSPQVFAQSLMHATRTNQARAVLSEVQTRHDDIKHIEKTILELHQLFSDMQMMVEQQGETLTNVEQHAENTVGDLKQGNTFLTKAIASARATRHKKWCCLVLVIIICVVIAILVWWFGFGHPGAAGNNNS
ncbi:hypothetical protein LRAMOSA05053 [Lichtheimia ramosa]|uniref:t-SNARE coiled-coil homology domain-containing protein n=1 Tax=Lichtheimia ramosa TaxID=688394 RepID=A0A077X042_9FUNG|nr:hypothetical protein LRAMOSA05053 [Lichtheimia ramosa]